jgi:hypothetical protein
MCPFCLATAAMIAGSATGTGGVTALIAGTILKRNKRRILPQGEELENGNNNNSAGNSEDGVAR